MKTEIEPGAEVVVVEPTMAEVEANGGTPEVTPEPTEVEATPEVSPALEPITEETPAQDAVDKRIGKITAEKYGFKREAESLRTELDQLKANQGKPQLPADAPKLEDFDYDDQAHQEALMDWKLDKKLEARTQASSQAQVETDKASVRTSFDNKEAEYAASHADYGDAVGALPKIPQDTLDTLYGMEKGPQLAHYLGKNLDVANEIANATPTMAAVKLGQISMGLTADTKTVKPSNAPEPVAVINGAASVTKSQDEMSMDEIMAL